MPDEAPKKRPKTRGELRAIKQRKEKTAIERKRRQLMKANLWRSLRAWKPDHRPVEIIITELCPTRIRAQYHAYVYDRGSYKALRGQYIHFVCRSYREFDRLTKTIAKVVKSAKWTDEENPDPESTPHDAGPHAFP